MSAALIEVSGLEAAYAPGPPAIAGVSFAAHPGERLAVLGPNGGGKTTLFRVLLGELEPRSGTVRLRGRPAALAQSDRSRPDYPVSALDVAVMGSLLGMPWWRRPGRRERRRAREALAQVGLSAQADATFGELSGGQRQRVLLARALVSEAEVLLLDEPFDGLDAAAAAQLRELIDRLAADGKVVAVATHDLVQARAWDRVLCLNGRQVAFGDPRSTLTREVLEATYGGEIVEVPTRAGPETEALLPPHHHEHGRGEGDGGANGDG